ncbi:hypothetical protein E4U59_000113 [Claviceps monticola]|nr:hypothetical protein E4U59_000113 [Claviceps monticola]
MGQAPGRPGIRTDCASLTPRQQWIFVNDSLADSIQKRLAHYFESDERRDWSATDFIAYLDTLYADSTTAGEARLQLHKLRQRANEPFTEFLVRFESQLAKADRLSIPDIDKIELLQVAFHTGFDARCNNHTDIPADNYAGAVAAYKAAAAKNRVLELGSALRRMPASSTTAGPSKDPEGDTVMTGVASAGFAGKGKGRARVQWVSKDVWEGRRSLGQCLRCVADDHQIRDCEILPAFRPAAAAGVGCWRPRVAMRWPRSRKTTTPEHESQRRGWASARIPRYPL